MKMESDESSVEVGIELGAKDCGDRSLPMRPALSVNSPPNPP